MADPATKRKAGRPSKADQAAKLARAEKPRRRDVRVDRIGFVGELVKHYVEGPTGIKAAVKGRMLSTEIVEGDLFEAILVEGTASSIDPAKLLRLYKEDHLSASQLCEMLTVKVGVAEKILSRQTFLRLKKTVPAADKLIVERKAGVEVKLIDAIRGLAAELLGNAQAA